MRPARRQAPTRIDERPAIRWARSGLMPLTGLVDGPPRLAAGDPMAGIAALIAEAEAASARLGRPISIDPRVLTERAALTGLTRQGQMSCGGGARLLEARDGWLAVNLPRPTDLLSVPAWVGGGLDEDPWHAVERGVRGRFIDDLVESGRRLDLAVSRVGVGGARRDPVTLRAMAAPAAMGRPPERLLVIDLSSLWAGPLCGHLLAEAGAQVIKIESLSRPDPVRLAAPAFFDRLHAGKESVALDFREEGDLERLRTLLLRADVVISSARPRAFEQLGLEPESVFAGNPSLVWVAITGHGWTGEGRNAIGFGDDAAAAAGLVAQDGAGRPLFAGDALADPLTGLAAAGGALEAIRRGGGFLVDASLVGAAGFVASFTSPSDAGLVFSQGSAWRVRSGDITVDVAAAGARPWRGSATPFGADTAAVLEALT